MSLMIPELGAGAGKRQPGSNIFEQEIYIQSRNSRLTNLFQHVDPWTLAGKRILDVGCGSGELGEEFVKLGCRVVSVDSRPEHIEILRAKFPEREASVIDLEAWDGSGLGSFDILLCFGTLYHISRPEAFLASCARIAPEIYLETMVCDSAEAKCLFVQEDGPDQATSGTGCRPSPSWIVAVMASHSFTTRDISSGLSNWAGGAPSIFDWAPRNDSSWMRDGAFLRKMFILSKAEKPSLDTANPLKREDALERAVAGLRAEADRRARALQEITAMLVSRDRLVHELEHAAAERLRLLGAAHCAAAELREELRRRRSWGGRDRRIEELERIAAERLTLLEAAHRAAAEIRVEAERRAEALKEVTEALAERDRRIEDLVRR
jgi:SAM-dependent methyltransferase